MATRTLVLLGRRPSLAMNELRSRLGEKDELVIRSLGYPVTAAQRAILLRAEELAAEVGAWFDATLVLSTEEMLSGVRRDDSIHVAARGLEARRLRKALTESRG